MKSRNNIFHQFLLINFFPLKIWDHYWGFWMWKCNLGLKKSRKNEIKFEISMGFFYYQVYVLIFQMFWIIFYFEIYFFHYIVLSFVANLRNLSKHKKNNFFSRHKYGNKDTFKELGWVGRASADIHNAYRVGGTPPKARAGDEIPKN